MAAYGFNEGSGTTLNDLSGNGRNGTISGATWTTQGRFGAALFFDGVNDQVQIGYASSLNLTVAMTLEAWVYPTASQSNWRAILVRGDELYGLYASNETGPMKPAGVWEFTGDVEDLVKSPTAIAPNVWTHLALTYDGAMLRLYINAVQVASKARTGQVASNTLPLRIGGNGPSGEFFKGRIDEVRMYSRALSQAEIQTDMNTAVVARPPVSVSVASPLNGATVASDSVTVSGSFEGPSNTGIAVNGVVAAISGKSFVAANVPLQLGANTLTVRLNTLDDQTATQTLSVTSTGPAAMEVLASPTQGVAPLGVTFTINNRTGNTIQSVQADYSGGGGYVIVDPKALSNTYAAAGIYQARFIITVSTGASYQQTVPIVVQDLAQIDQMLRTAWSEFSTALATGNTMQALTYFNAQAQQKFQSVFQTLAADLPQIVASFSPPQPVSVTNEIGEYAINRTIAGVDWIFFVYFLRDADGVWRIDDM